MPKRSHDPPNRRWLPRVKFAKSEWSDTVIIWSFNRIIGEVSCDEMTGGMYMPSVARSTLAELEESQKRAQLESCGQALRCRRRALLSQARTLGVFLSTSPRSQTFSATQTNLLSFFRSDQSHRSSYKLYDYFARTHTSVHTAPSHIAAMAEPETTVMLDQAQVDAAEAAQDAQENGGADMENEYIGRRPSSSGRETKRYRKCRLPSLPCMSASLSTA